MMRAFEGADAGRRGGGLGGVCSRRGIVHAGCAPHSLFGLAQKENAPRPVEEKKALRRVGLRRRRPPAAGGGWLAVPCGGQGRKRPALGDTFGPGKFGIHAAPIFAAAGRWSMKASAWASATPSTTARGARSEAERAERGAGQMRPCTPTRSEPPPRDGSRGNRRRPKRARRPGKIGAGTDTPTSVSTEARRRRRAPKAVFSFGPCTARFLFHKREKKMGGASPLDKPPWREPDPPVAAVRRPASPAQRTLTDPPATAAWTCTAARPVPGTAPRWGWCGAGSPPPPAPGW